MCNQWLLKSESLQLPINMHGIASVITESAEEDFPFNYGAQFADMFVLFRSSSRGCKKIYRPIITPHRATSNRLGVKA